MDFFNISFSSILSIFIIFLIFSFAYLYVGAPKNLPPGSAGLPIVGYLPFLSQFLHLTFRKLGKEKYGNVFHLYFGSSLIIVLNDFAAIKEALVKQGESFKGRPPDANFAETKDENQGLLINDGEPWRQHRRFILSNLKDNGVGKLTLEPLILNEIQYFLNELKKHEGEALEIKDLLTISLSNNIHLLVTGQRFDYDHPITKAILEIFRDFVELTKTISPITFFPWLKYIPGIDFLLSRKRRRKVIQDFLQIIDSIIQNVKKNYKDGENDTYVQAYFTEKNERLKVNQKEDIFTDIRLLHNARDLLAAGTDTSASTLLWALLYITKFPRVQKKVQLEIDQNIGQEREPSFNDRSKTPYTEATILEIQRMSSLLPLVPRRTIKTTPLFDYTIPKDTMVMVNVYNVHHDATLWGDPESFRPERFLGENGEVVRPEYLIPFGLGKRVCVGEPLAKMELYLYFTSLLQHFDFVPVNGHETSVEAKPGFFLQPKHPIVCCKPRTFRSGF